jgi:hypothetical protein
MIGTDDGEGVGEIAGGTMVRGESVGRSLGFAAAGGIGDPSGHRREEHGRQDRDRQPGVLCQAARDGDRRPADEQTLHELRVAAEPQHARRQADHQPPSESGRSAVPIGEQAEADIPHDQMPEFVHQHSDEIRIG